MRRSRTSGAPSGSGRVNYLASVSDLMSALLFVFILTLAVAIIQARTAAGRAELEAERARTAQSEALEAREEALKARKEALTARAEAIEAAEKARRTRDDLQAVQTRLAAVESRLEGNARTLRILLNELRDKLTLNGIPVDIDATRGVLRIPESAVTFAVGSSVLDEGNRRKVLAIGKALAGELRCFQVDRLKDPDCKSRNPYGHTLDAVLIEGHTDNQAYRGDATGRRNRLLSTARSSAVFDVMVSGNAQLENLTNAEGERLFSLSGYGAARPLPGHEYAAPTNDPANRRIEFRFIMTPPAINDEESRLIRTPAPEGTAALDKGPAEATSDAPKGVEPVEADEPVKSEAHPAPAAGATKSAHDAESPAATTVPAPVEKPVEEPSEKPSEVKPEPSSDEGARP